MEIYKEFIEKVNYRVESLCTEFFNSGDKELRDMYIYAMRGGRRYRPSLVLTGKLICDKTFDDKTIKIATFVELIHKYSLILDDVVDNDPLRRGKETFYNKYGGNNAYAMSAYFMNIIFREFNEMRKLYEHSVVFDSMASLFEEVLSDMSVGFISDLNNTSRDIRGIRSISNMQTSTLLRNSMLLGFISSDYYSDNECSFIYKALCNIGNNMGTIFQAYNDIEVFCGPAFQMANKGQLYTDFANNRKNIVLSKIPLKVIRHRDTNELIDYINNNHLFKDVFSEIFDVLSHIKHDINTLPDNSIGKTFLIQFLLEKEDTIKKLSLLNITKFNDLSQINAM